MDETKKTFLKKDIKENGQYYIKECLKNPNLKEISFYSKNNYKKNQIMI
jgi:hypothetical protein